MNMKRDIFSMFAGVMVMALACGGGGGKITAVTDKT
jgi:hypothetical protein